jgi:hypothetical protein
MIDIIHGHHMPSDGEEPAGAVKLVGQIGNGVGGLTVGKLGSGTIVQFGIRAVGIIGQ